MVLDYYFEVSTHMKPTDVVELLSNPTILLPLWSIYEELTEIKGLDEFITKLNIAGTSFLVKFKLKKTIRENKTVITLIGTGPVSMRIILRVEPRDAGSAIKCRVSIRAGFFRERTISGFINSFVEDFKNKLTFQLPLLIEALGVGKGGHEVEGKSVKVEEGRVQLASEKPPYPQFADKDIGAKHKEEIIKELVFSENPDILQDDIFLSSVVLKSTLIKFKQVDIKGNEILKILKDIILAELTKYGDMFYVSINCTSLRIKIYVENSIIKGLRIEFDNGHILNGTEALRYLRALHSLGCRAYVFGVSQ